MPHPERGSAETRNSKQRKAVEGSGSAARWLTCAAARQNSHPSEYLIPRLLIDINRIAVIILGNERRHSLFKGCDKSKAAYLRAGARNLAIESDRHSTGR